MKILVIATRYPVASGRYCADALRRMGHDVREAGPDAPRGSWCDAVPDDQQWAFEAPEDGWKADLFLIMDSGVQVDISGAPVAVYGVDNHVRDYRQFDGIADRFFLAHGHGARIGEANVQWLPCGYDAHTFTPGPPLAQRENDAALIGVIYNERASLLYALNGYRILYDTGAIYADYAAKYHSAKVSLVRSVNDDVAQRVWETAAMGCLVLKDANSDDEALGLENWKNCLTYTSDREARDLLAWVQEHPKDAQKIARAGAKWAQSGTWAQRLQVIIDWATAQQTPRKRGKSDD